MFLLCLQDELFVFSDSVDSLFNVILLDQCKLHFSVEVEEKSDVFYGIHCLYAVLDVEQTLR